MKQRILCLLALLPLLLQAQTSVTVNPDRGHRGNRLSVTLTGVNTHFNSGSNTVQFFYQGSPTLMVQAQSSGVFTSTSMQANLFISGSATLGAYTYKVYNATDLMINGTQPFYVTPDTGGAARIVSVDPGVCTRNTSLHVTITGYQTQFTQGSPSLTFLKQGSTTLHIFTSNVQVMNDTLMSADIFASMAADTGFYIAFVNNGAGIWNKPDALWVVDGPIGMTELAAEQPVKVYPNPAKTEIHVSSKSAVLKTEITDLHGRSVQTDTPPEPRKELQIQLDAAILPDAWYLLRIYTENAVIIRKIRIQ